MADDKNFPMAAVITHIDHSATFSRMLDQLEESGIYDIYILLDKKEYDEATTKKIKVYDDTSPPVLALDFQKSRRKNSKLKFHLINSENANTAEEKLNFYLQNTKDEYSLNLLITKDKLGWSNPNLLSISHDLKRSTITLKFLKYQFFKTSSWHQEIFSLESLASKKAVELANREKNPFYCHQIANFDHLHYQWLFNIFAELVKEQIQASDNSTVKKNAIQQIKHVMKDYYKNVIDSDNAEDYFYKLHRKVYPPSDVSPSYWTKYNYSTSVIKKEEYHKKFPVIINQLIEIYKNLRDQQVPDRRMENYRAP